MLPLRCCCVNSRARKEDEEAGKKLAMEAAAALSLDLPTFLLQRCATYCIAI